MDLFFLPFCFSCLLVVPIRTMPAAAQAAMAAFEMVFFGEHNVAFFAHVIIFRIKIEFGEILIRHWNSRPGPEGRELDILTPWQKRQ